MSAPTKTNRETLLTRNGKGSTLLHALAKAGRIGEVPADSLDGEAMLTQGENGDTPLHLAAREGYF